MAGTGGAAQLHVATRLRFPLATLLTLDVPTFLYLASIVAPAVLVADILRCLSIAVLLAVPVLHALAVLTALAFPALVEEVGVRDASTAGGPPQPLGAVRKDVLVLSVVALMLDASVPAAVETLDARDTDEWRECG